MHFIIVIARLTLKVLDQVACVAFKSNTHFFSPILKALLAIRVPCFIVRAKACRLTNKYFLGECVCENNLVQGILKKELLEINQR